MFCVFLDFFFFFAICVGVLRGGVRPAEIGEAETQDGNEGAVWESLRGEVVFGLGEWGRGRRRRRSLAKKKRNRSREREAKEKGLQIRTSPAGREDREEFFERRREGFEVLVLDAGELATEDFARVFPGVRESLGWRFLRQSWGRVLSGGSRVRNLCGGPGMLGITLGGGNKKETKNSPLNLVANIASKFSGSVVKIPSDSKASNGMKYLMYAVGT